MFVSLCIPGFWFRTWIKSLVWIVPTTSVSAHHGIPTRYHPCNSPSRGPHEYFSDEHRLIRAYEKSSGSVEYRIFRWNWYRRFDKNIESLFETHFKLLLNFKNIAKYPVNPSLRMLFILNLKNRFACFYNRLKGPLRLPVSASLLFQTSRLWHMAHVTTTQETFVTAFNRYRYHTRRR
jgi:hypothetical protein